MKRLRFLSMSSILDFAFSVNSTRSHETDTVAFSNLSTLESVFIENDTSFSSFVFVWTGRKNATKCFQMKTHACGRGLTFPARWVSKRDSKRFGAIDNPELFLYFRFSR